MAVLHEATTIASPLGLSSPSNAIGRLRDVHDRSQLSVGQERRQQQGGGTQAVPTYKRVAATEAAGPNRSRPVW